MGFCDGSARWIFGKVDVNPADKIAGTTLELRWDADRWFRVLQFRCHWA